MAEIKEMNEVELLNLEILRLVMSDRAAAEKAIVFIGGSRLRYELFKDWYQLATSENTPISRTDKAIRESTEALSLFGKGADNAGS